MKQVIHKLKGEVTVGVIAILASVTISAIGGVTLLFGRSYAKAEEAVDTANEAKTQVLLLKQEMKYLKDGMDYLVEVNDNPKIRLKYPSLLRSQSVATSTHQIN